MSTEFFRRDKTRRIQVYIELRDMWFGVFWPENATYICLFGLVVRIARKEGES